MLAGLPLFDGGEDAGAGMESVEEVDCSDENGNEFAEEGGYPAPTFALADDAKETR